jgi:phenylalanyl-tRNA synthetase beta chain
LERKIKDIVSLEHHFTEVYNYSFVSPYTLKQLDLHIEDHVELDNPIAKDRPYLRMSMVPNLLENVEKNVHLFDEVRLFEMGKVFWKNFAGEREKKGSDHLLPKQDVMWGIAYSAKGDQTPFYTVQHTVGSILTSLGVSPSFVAHSEQLQPWLHPGRLAHIEINGTTVGYITELHPEKQERFGMLSRVALSEIDLNVLLPLISFKSNYKHISEYPEVKRDVAFVVDKKVQHIDIVKEIQSVDRLIVNVELFDVYEGTNVGEGKKSVAYHITYLSGEKTLETGEVDKVHGKVTDVLKKKFNAEVRK